VANGIASAYTGRALRVGQYAPLEFFGLWTNVHQISFAHRGMGCSCIVETVINLLWALSICTYNKRRTLTLGLLTAGLKGVCEDCENNVWMPRGSPAHSERQKSIATNYIRDTEWINGWMPDVGDSAFVAIRNFYRQLDTATMMSTRCVN